MVDSYGLDWIGCSGLVGGLRFDGDLTWSNAHNLPFFFLKKKILKKKKNKKKNKKNKI